MEREKQNIFYDSIEITDVQTTLLQLTYCSAEQFLPVRFEVEDHSPPGPRQSGPTDEQHQEDQIRKSGSHPNNLMQNNMRFNFLLSCLMVINLHLHQEDVFLLGKYTLHTSYQADFHDTQ